LLSLWKSSSYYGIRWFIEIFISSIWSSTETWWTTCNTKNARLFSLIYLSLFFFLFILPKEKAHNFFVPLKIIVHIPFFCRFSFFLFFFSFQSNVYSINKKKQKKIYIYKRKFLGKGCIFYDDYYFCLVLFVVQSISMHFECYLFFSSSFFLDRDQPLCICV